MEKYLDLNRKFGHLVKYSSTELHSLGLRAKRISWDQILKGRYSVIVGRANFGKTSEFRAKNEALRQKGKASVFVALHRVFGEDDFVDALEVAEQDAFNAWKQKGGELIVFVDSLDEVALASKDGIAKALRKVGNAIGQQSDVRWVLSTRPAVLTNSVLTLLQQELRTTLFQKGEQAVETAFDADESDADADSIEGKSSDAGGVGEAGANGMLKNKTVKQGQLKIYALNPLDRRAAGLYLREHVGIAKASETLQAARRYGLERLTDSPGGLDILGHINPVQSPPQHLTEVFERISDAMQEQQRTDPREQLLESAQPEAFGEAIQCLAAASMVCGLPNIELSEVAFQFQPGVLSARPVLAHLLRESSLKYLLGSRVFIDAGQHQVKFYPDDLLPFLAAKRLAGLVKSPEHAQRLLTNFSWKSVTGECGVYRELLTLAGWLSVYSSHCRKVLLEIEPQAVAFFGDLRNPSISLHEATMALERAIERLVVGGDSIGRRHFTLTAENYWQVTKAGITPVLEGLYQKYGADINARDVLFEIAGHATSEIFRDVVLDGVGWDYEKLLSDQLGLRYILELGRQDDSDGLAAALFTQPQLSEDRVATVIGQVAWRSLDAKGITQLVVQQFERSRGGYSLDWVITGTVAENAGDVELYRLVRTLMLHLLNRKIRRGRTSEEFRSDQKYLELVLDVLAAFIGRLSVSISKTVALSLVMDRFMKSHYLNADFEKLHSALRGNRAVRLALLKALVASTDKTSNGIMEGVFMNHSFYPYVEGDEFELSEPGFTASVGTRKKNSKKPPPVAAHKAGKEQKLDPKSKRLLSVNLENIRLGKDDSALSWAGEWLYSTIRESRFGECDFAALRAAAGDQIADAIRAGLSKHWRQREPLWDEGVPNSTYNLTVAGLQGLFLDLGDGSSLPMLSKVEVQRAIRYAVFEINGYPKWFWKLVHAHSSIGEEELKLILANAGRGIVSMAHAEALVRALDDAPTELQPLLAQVAWEFVGRTPSVGEYTAKMALKIAATHSVIEQATLEREALSLMQNAFNEEMPTTENLVFGSAGEHQAHQEKINELTRLRTNALTWGGLWLCTYPRSFSLAWKGWDVANSRAAQDFMFSLATELGQERGARLTQVSDKGQEGLEVLKMLYHWSHSSIPVEDDPKRENFKVYSPTHREHAQALRDALVPAIAHAKSEQAYQILEDIRLSTSGAASKYLRYTQFMMREEQYPRNQIEQRLYLEFERNLAPKVSSYINFAMAVENDLLTVKSQVETGDFSLRRFFNGISFDRVKTDNDGLALEDDFQSLLGSELNHASGGRYAVSLESILPGGTRRDVLCQMDDFKATIELKMSVRWTVDNYIEALEKQLQGQYMMAENSKIGFFVIVLQTKDRKWDLPGGGQIGFDRLLELLKKVALQKQIADNSLYLRVIGIDASPKADFRQERTVKPATKAGTVKFADGKGNVWSGRGKHPKWLKDAISSGAKRDDFLVK